MMDAAPINPPLAAGSSPTLAASRVGRPGSFFSRSPILPQSFKQPLALLWVAILPQIVLLLLNIQDYRLVSGEMAQWQRGMSARIVAFQILLILGSTALILVLRRRRSLLPTAICWALLLLPIGYLWLVTYQIVGALIPASVTAWILRPETVLYDQFAFMMPLIFYAAVRLSCIDINVSRRAEYVTLSTVIAGIPLLFAAVVKVEPRWLFLNRIGTVGLIVILVACTVIVLTAAIRLLVTAYLAVRKKGPFALGLLAFFVGIAGPIGGLLLNRRMPFPADFQSPTVYGLALVNGLLLLAPNFAQAVLHRIVWFAQCLLFPFTIYFFLVFLPFLLLSIPAMALVGAGFLILTPTALFLVHGQRIYDGYRNEIRDGSRLRPALLGLFALVLLPSVYTIGALVDHFTLGKAIAYIYTPDYREHVRFGGNTAFVRNSLEHLRDSKAGLDLPFLSRYYNWIVFDGLVLPDEKLNYIYRAFFGRELPKPAPSEGFLPTQTPLENRIRPGTAVIPQDVRLIKATTIVESDEACRRARVSLDLQSGSAMQSEFVSAIELPEGAFVSGFWLHIGPDRVAGQIFEKKTALWVYQMIRDQSRRDPGLLAYTGAQTLELRVFPFSANERRRVEIEFLYPAGINPAIRIGEEIIHPSSGPQSSGIIAAQTRDFGSAIWIGPSTLETLPRLTRTPYLHFIVDRSIDSDVTEAKLTDVMQAARKKFPEAREYRVTAVNYEVHDLTSGMAPLDSLTASGLDAMPRRGGFLPGREIKHALLNYQDELERRAGDPSLLNRFPLFIVVASSHGEPLVEPDLLPFARFIPDTTGYYVSKVNNIFEPRSFDGNSSITQRPVTLFKLGDAIAACDHAALLGRLIHLNSVTSPDRVCVLDPIAGTFIPPASIEVIPSTTRYAEGVAASHAYLSSIYNPAAKNQLAQIVNRSRESGILVGGTSFIVVENSAQWRVLARKEKQKLRNNATLEFEAVPEPSTWSLVFIGAACLICWSVRKKVYHRRSHS